MPLSRKQVEAWQAILASETRFILLDGSIRSGKTFSSLLGFLHLLTNPDCPLPAAIIGKTRTTIQRNIINVIKQISPTSITHVTRRSDTATIEGKEVHLIGANDEGAEEKIRGLTLGLAYVDEVTLMPEAAFVQLRGRLSVPGAKMIGTTNPDSPYHWLKTNYINRIPTLTRSEADIRADGVEPLTDWAYHHFQMSDNPGLPPEYVEAKKREFTGLWYRRFIQGQWVSAEGAIYDMWDEHKHVTPWDELPPIREVLATGIDYGTTNATSAITLGITVDGRLALLDEWRLDAGNRGLTPWTDAQQSQAITKYLGQQHAPTNAQRPRFVYTDPAAASFKTQLYQDGVHNLHNADNHVVDGIRQVASLLEQGKLIVSSKCTGFIQEVPGYAWDSKATANGEDKPIKLNDHSLDAARYVIYSTRHLWRHQLNKP